MLIHSGLFLTLVATAAAVALPAESGVPSAASSAAAAKPTLYLAGDSTMANNGGGEPGAVGWGVPLPYSMDLPVVNKAIGGRSARSYTVQGRFQAIIDVVQPGDFVIIEFGHNDGGNYSDPNGRADCPGNDGETCWDPTSNSTVYTFHAYMVWAGRNLTEKGANVVISSQTPTNPYEFGSFNYTPSVYVEYAKEAARSIGRGATYVDHGAYIADRERWMNGSYVDTLYPMDHTHTDGDGADLVAKAFVKAIKCTRGISLAHYVVNSTWSIPGRCLH